MTQYQNYYECPCGTTWNDEWDCMCDDRCPVCNSSCSPSDSAEIDDDPQSYRDMPIPSYYIKAAQYLADTMGPAKDPAIAKQFGFIKKMLQSTSPQFCVANELDNNPSSLKQNKTKDWEQLSFKSGGPTLPSKTKRTELRAKRRAKSK